MHQELKVYVIKEWHFHYNHYKHKDIYNKELH